MPNDPLNISAIGVRPPSLESVQPKVAPAASGQVEGKSFQDVLSDAVGEVQRLQNEADTTIKQLVSGEIGDVTEAMVAVEKADVAFQSMMLVRSKMVAAYEEIMRMQV